MADSLRDQLVKAGLASNAQAKKAERELRAEQNARRGKGKAKGKRAGQGQDKATAGPETPQDTRPAQSPARRQQTEQQAQKKQRDKALAREANEKAAAKALRAQMRQLILSHDQRSKSPAEDDVPYNFVHGTRIKKIFVPPAQRDQLSHGRLVIVNNDGNYHLVAPDVAEKIRARDPKRIIAAHADKPPEPGPDDDFYARFEVPDDLDW